MVGSKIRAIGEPPVFVFLALKKKLAQGGERPRGAEKGMGMQILFIFGIEYAFFIIFIIGNADFALGMQFFFHWECIPFYFWH